MSMNEIIQSYVRKESMTAPEIMGNRNVKIQWAKSNIFIRIMVRYRLLQIEQSNLRVVWKTTARERSFSNEKSPQRATYEERSTPQREQSQR